MYFFLLSCCAHMYMYVITSGTIVAPDYFQYGTCGMHGKSLEPCRDCHHCTAYMCMTLYMTLYMYVHVVVAELHVHWLCNYCDMCTAAQVTLSYNLLTNSEAYMYLHCTCTCRTSCPSSHEPYFTSPVNSSSKQGIGNHQASLLHGHILYMYSSMYCLYM